MGTFSSVLISFQLQPPPGNRYTICLWYAARPNTFTCGQRSVLSSQCSSQCCVGPSISKQTLLTFTDKQRSQSSHHTKPTQTDRRTTSNIGERERPEPQNQLGCPSSGFLGIIMWRRSSLILQDWVWSASKLNLYCHSSDCLTDWHWLFSLLDCVTLWETDDQGEQIWAGTEQCEPVTWQECELVEKEVQFIVPEVRSSIFVLLGTEI